MTVYRSYAVRMACDAEQARLDRHHASPDGGLCVVCLSPAPCPVANEAAGFLAERGLLVPREREREQERERATLLTHAWKVRFGIPGRRR